MLHPMNDGTLDVLILGPMGAGVAASEQNCVRLKAAVESLLGHAEFTERLRACGYQRFNVTAPEHLQGNRIANEVFRELDKADLVVLDLSSRPGTTAPSPNVMYELALVHALGLPFMLISSTMDPAPFYVAHDRVRHAAYDKLEATAAEVYGLNLLVENVEDADHNTTRFVALSTIPLDPATLDPARSMTRPST